MSRVEWNGWGLAALLSVVVLGCSSELVNLNRQVASKSPEQEEWQTTGRELRGYDPGIFAITYGPSAEGPLGGRLIAATRTPVDPSNMRVSRLFSAGPRLTIWDATGVELLSQEVPHSSGCVRFRRDGTECLFTADDGILAWHRDDRTVHKLCATSGPPETISADCRLFALREYADKRTLVRVFQVEDQYELGSIEVPGIVMRAQFVDEDDRLGLVVDPPDASSKAEAFVWDYTTQRETAHIPSGWGRGVFSADGLRYAGEAENNAVRAWDTETGSLLFTTGPHSGSVWAMAFSPDGRFLASAGEGTSRRDRAFGEIKVWDAAIGTEVTTIIDESSWGVTALAFSPEGTELASGNGDGIVRFWRVPVPN